MLLKNVSIIALLAFVIFSSGCGTPKPTDMQLASGISYTDRHPKANLNKIKELVSAGQNVNEKGWGGETVLRTAINSSVSHKADSFNYLAIADYLLDHGADPNAPSEMSQDSILMMAVSSNNRQLVEKLLAKGANVNYVNVYERSALSTAASLGNADLVEYLLAQVSDKYSQAQSAFVTCSYGLTNISSQTTNPNEPAANRNYKFVAIFEILLNAGANVNAMSIDGQYALHNATYAANAEVVRYFLKIGANPDITDGLRNETALNLALRVKGEPANRNNKSLQGKYDEVIAVLKPVTSISKQIANANNNLAEPNPVINSVAECLKLKAALKICENIPWPVSLGCNALAKSNYGNSYCQM